MLLWLTSSYTWIIESNWLLIKLVGFNSFNLEWLSCIIMLRLLLISILIFLILGGFWYWSFSAWSVSEVKSDKLNHSSCFCLSTVYLTLYVSLLLCFKISPVTKTLLLFFGWVPLGTGWKSYNHTVITIVVCGRVLGLWCLNHFLICFTRNTFGSVANFLNNQMRYFEYPMYIGEKYHIINQHIYQMLNP